ncbi:unnamed protein product [Caenorhabditis bovis]|uniref:MRH domain-containing protein n=1 Tax=Caenorhabditis bovis TaxID=2654633 RepID=A0A8S1EUW4_9PELO|nr:unnamed protein product [Caenorhabditis bovis]
MSMRLAIILLVLAVGGVRASAGMFDIAQLREISYDADISDNILWFAPTFDIAKLTPENIDEIEQELLQKLPKENDEKYTFLTSNVGQKFACSIPEFSPNKTDVVPPTSRNPAYYADIISASFYVTKCIQLKTNGWWRYTLCRGNYIEQTHGNKGDPDFANYLLGMFDGNFSMPDYQMSTADRLLYVEESYSSGTLCDLENHRESRSSRVKYECDVNLGSQEAYIVSVDEIRPCRYEIRVKVGSLCTLSEFLAPNQLNHDKIMCYPYIGGQNIKKMLEKHLRIADMKAFKARRFAQAKQEVAMATYRTIGITTTRLAHLLEKSQIAQAEMDYKARLYEFLLAKITLLESSEDAVASREKGLWALVDINVIPTVHTIYDSPLDMDRGNLWFYFHDRAWPKKVFPRYVKHVAIENAYFKHAMEALNKALDDQMDGRISFETLRQRFNALMTHGAQKPRWVINLHGNEVLDALKSQFFAPSYSFKSLISELFAQHRFERYIALKEDADVPFLLKGFEISEKLFQQCSRDISIMIRRGGPDILEDVHPEGFNQSEYKFIYSGLEFTRNKSGMYNVRIPDLQKYREELEANFTRLLYPVYNSLRAQYYIRNGGGIYFFLPDLEFIHQPHNPAYRFHKNLAKDLAVFAAFLSDATLFCLSGQIQMYRYNQAHVSEENSHEVFWKLFLAEARSSKEDEERIVKKMEDLLVGGGNEEMEKALKTVWNKKAEQYWMAYLKEEDARRKEEKALLDIIDDLMPQGWNQDISPMGVKFKQHDDTESMDLFDVARKFDEATAQIGKGDAPMSFEEFKRQKALKRLESPNPNEQDDGFSNEEFLNYLFNHLEKTGSDFLVASEEDLETLMANKKMIKQELEGFMDELRIQTELHAKKHAYTTKYEWNDSESDEPKN